MFIKFPCKEGWDSQGFHSGHKAIDIGWLMSESSNGHTPILACADGVVEIADYYEEVVNGKRVKPIVCIIRHDNLDPNYTYYSAYWHLSRTPKNTGDVVKMGDEIGTKGNTGYSGGVHLHFVLMKCPRGTKVPSSYEFNKYAVNPIEHIRVFEGQVFRPNGGNFDLKKFEGVLPVEKNEEVNQVLVECDGLRIRAEPNTTSSVIGTCEHGYFNVHELSKKEDYTWYRIESNMWIAGVDGVTYHEKKSEGNEEELLKVIDVSYYQPKVDYKKLKDSGIQGAIIRCGRTGWGEFAMAKDSLFETHYKGFKDVGIPVGVYYYSCANTVELARKEALFVLDIIRGKKFEFPIYFDVENNERQGKLSKQALTNITKEFCEVIENAGYYVGVYSSKSWLETKLDMNQLKAYDVWVAQYNTSCTYKGSYGMWQYTSTGSVNGISGNVDLNKCYKDYPTIIKKAGLNGYGESTPKPNAEVEALKKEVEALESQVKTLNTELEQKNVYVVELEKEISILNDELDDLQGEKEKIELEYSEKVKTLETALNDVTEKLDKIKEIIGG